MSNYTDFALVYDLLMLDADYDGRTEYIIKLFEKFGKKPTLLLDLACGTGEFSVRFANKGAEVIGVDMSEDMLSVAREKNEALENPVLFLCQPAEELDLFGTVDGAVCLMDSINHITDSKTLKTALSKVSLFLEKDCLFIFDVNTVYKHRNVLQDNTFVLEDEDVFCVWQNQTDQETLVTDIILDFFVGEGNRYERFSEAFSERAYPIESLKEMLMDVGLKTLAVLDDMSFDSPSEHSERVFFVTRKM